MPKLLPNLKLRRPRRRRDLPWASRSGQLPRIEFDSDCYKNVRFGQSIAGESGFMSCEAATHRYTAAVLAKPNGAVRTRDLLYWWDHVADQIRFEFNRGYPQQISSKGRAAGGIWSEFTSGDISPQIIDNEYPSHSASLSRDLRRCVAWRNDGIFSANIRPVPSARIPTRAYVSGGMASLFSPAGLEGCSWRRQANCSHGRHGIAMATG